MRDIDPMAMHEEIEKRAYEIYLRRGGADGRDLDDWFAAEQELARSEATTASYPAAVAKSSRNRRYRDWSDRGRLGHAEFRTLQFKILIPFRQRYGYSCPRLCVLVNDGVVSRAGLEPATR